MPNIGIVSTFPPTQCGIATYAYDLIQSVKKISPNYNFIKIEVISNPNCSNAKNYTLQNSNARQFLNACDYIYSSDIDVIDIQHEFKIFGKPDGKNLSILLNNIQKPIVSTIHTIFTSLNKEREKILVNIVRRSDQLYVFSEEAKIHLIKKYKKEQSKIQVIPHGVPIIKFKKNRQIQNEKIFPSPIVFVSAGHMRNTKGYEIALTALHSLRNKIPDFQYLILGPNHPENETSQLYRETLLNLVSELNLSNNVKFISNYLKTSNLIKYIQNADIGLLPYTRKDQSSSGILALMFACGKPVVSTPFQFAKSYINQNSGVISRSFNFLNFEKALSIIISKRNLWNDMSKHNHALGKTWSWKKNAHKYISGYEKLIHDYSYL